MDRATSTVLSCRQASPPVRLALMVTVRVHSGSERRRARLVNSLVFGRGQSCDVILNSGKVSREHLRLQLEGGVVHFTDLGSANGTFLNGARAQKGELASGAVLRIGDADLSLEPPLHFGEEERSMQQGVQDDVPGTREVYADWLEARGREDEARYLRLELSLREAPAQAFATQFLEFRELSDRVALEFRAVVSRPMVEGCEPRDHHRFVFKCPRRWSALALTDDPRVRHCDACSKPVYFSANVDEAMDHARRGECVAVDVSQVRRESLDEQLRHELEGSELEPDMGEPLIDEE